MAPASDKTRGTKILACMAGPIVNALLFGPDLALAFDGQNDFMGFFVGARLAFTGAMYDVPRNLQVQREAAGWQNPGLLFIRLPFQGLLIWPLTLLPYLTAQHLWEALIVVTVALFCWLWPYGRMTAALACCWSFPLVVVFSQGQDVAILLVVIAFTLREMNRGRAGLAGLVFSLCAIKFHLFLLLPLLIIRQKLWRFLAGFSAGALVLCGASFLAGGWQWPLNYSHPALLPASNPKIAMMVNLHGFTMNLPGPLIWQLAGSLAVALAVWHACRKPSFEHCLAAVLVGGLLVAPHDYLADCALLIPALLITLRSARHRWQRYFHAWLLSPLSSIWAGNYHTWVTISGMIGYLLLLGFELPVEKGPR